MLTTTEKIPALMKLWRSVTRLKEISDSPILGKKFVFWVAGGAVTAAVAGERINDYDIFSPHPQRIISELESQAEYVKGKSVEGFFTNFTDKYGNTIQVITRVAVESPRAIFEIFDYTIVCGAYDGETFYCHDRFWQDVATRRLVMNSLTFPLKTLERVAKYSRRGYKACPFGLLDLCKTINRLQIDWDAPDQNHLAFYPDGTPRFNGVD